MASALGTPDASRIRMFAPPTGRAVVTSVTLPDNAPAVVVVPEGSTISVNSWLVLEPTPLLAVITSGYEPAAAGLGVPVSVAVPSPLTVKTTPLGNVPV